ncbi:MAG: serine/threonine-protein kinase [Cyanobacteria bacterium J06627_28]
MAYCFNPVCPQPQNADADRFCRTCGTSLILKNRYWAEALLGQGGFGRTFLGRDFETGKPCVLKQIYRSAFADESGFKREASRLRKLGEHPQIPRLFDAVEAESGQFLVQEFAPGQNLQALVEQAGPLAEKDVRSLLTSLVDVLQYVHSFQIIHRDIKPDNIVMLSENDGKKQLPMLVDFGAAKWVKHGPAKTVIGSAGYAAPEQSMGQATFASDIYSLGLTCIHLLTGVHPFAMYSAAEERWVWQDYLSEPLTAELARVLEKMVVRSLQNRYSTMAEVSLDLSSAQSSASGLFTTSKQIVSKATAAVPNLKTLLEKPSTLSNIFSKGQSKTSATALPAGGKGRVKTSPLQLWKRVHRLAPSIGLTQRLAMSSDGATMASGGADGAVRLWHWPTGQLVHTFARRRLMGDGHTAEITALAFHPDGRALYSASADGTIKEWDSAERCLLNTLPTRGWTPTDLQVSADGTQLVSANRDGKMVVWEITTLLPVAQLAQHQKRVNAIALLQTPAAYLLASASDDGTLKFWRQQFQKDTPQLTKNIRIGRNGERVVGLAVAQLEPVRGTFRLVAATPTAVWPYEVDEHLEVSEPVRLCQSEQVIRAIALNKDNLLAVGSEDRMLTLWDVSTGDRVAELAHDWGVNAAVFSPDGRSLVAASEDEVISIWQCETAEPSAYAR